MADVFGAWPALDGIAAANQGVDLYNGHEAIVVNGVLTKISGDGAQSIYEVFDQGDVSPNTRFPRTGQRLYPHNVAKIIFTKAHPILMIDEATLEDDILQALMEDDKEAN